MSSILDVFKQFHEAPIHYYPIHKRLTGRMTTALLLAYICRQIVYHKSNKVYQTDDQVREATGLSLDELKSAKQHLKEKNLVEITREGAKGRTHYQVNDDGMRCALKSLIVEIPVCGKYTTSPPPDCGLTTNSYKENNKKENNTLSAIAKRDRRTDSDPSFLRWRRMSISLADAISKVKKINKNSDVHCWDKSFELLHTRNGVEIKRIKKALNWYCVQLPLQYGEKFFLNIQSGPDFREKFDRVEAAMQREQEKKRDETQNSSDYDPSDPMNSIRMKGTSKVVRRVHATREMIDAELDREVEDEASTD